MVPDKVAYTSGEKKAEILGGIMLAVFAAVIIALMALGVSGCLLYTSDAADDS